MSKWPYVTSRWQKLRLVKLNECPVCYACEQRGQTELATTVDHVTPISQGGNPFPELSGLMALCERCHNEKTSGFDRRELRAVDLYEISVVAAFPAYEGTVISARAKPSHFPVRDLAALKLRILEVSS